MADYCWQCTEEILGLDGRENGLRGLCAKGMQVMATCDGCGGIWVGHDGVCWGGAGCCERHHNAPQGCLGGWDEVAA